MRWDIWVKGFGPLLAMLLLWAGFSAHAFSDAVRTTPEAVLDARYRLVLDLVRHTATYSPPVASRAFAYFGVIGYEVTESGRTDMATLVGQLRDLKSLPKREPGATYDEAAVLDAALSSATRRFFDNTGPTGQRAMKAMDAKFTPTVVAGLPANGRNLVRRPPYSRLTGQNCDDFCRPGNRAGLPGLDGGTRWIRTRDISRRTA